MKTILFACKRRSVLTLFLATFLIFLGKISFGQYEIIGQVKDTINFEFTQYTSVSLIGAKDSILIGFTRTTENGHFSIMAPDTGTYLLLLEHPRFASFVDKIKVEGDLDLGIIPLISKRNLLKEVVIKGRQAITIKGDTVEYAADSFKTRQFDDVDALLRQLPGIEVSSDGSIRAYGQTVQKMLVDGDEFFSDDPAMVAKMLRASDVDAVQVYDGKTDEAEFTGIDDGERIKTINLKLKEDAKTGYFGKVKVGGGLKKYYENQALLNYFKGKRKIAGYFNMSNTANGGLSFSQSQTYGNLGSEAIAIGGGVGFRVPEGSNSDYSDGSFRGEGLPKTYNGGVTFSDSWKGDTIKAGGSYNFFRNEVNTLNNTITQYILPDTQYFNTQNYENDRVSFSQALNLNATYKIDSLTTLRFRANGTLANNHNTSKQQSQATAPNGQLLNENNQLQTNQGGNKSGRLFLGLMRKFLKSGRSLALTFEGNFTDQHSKGLLQSDYHLFAIDSTHITNQQKLNDYKSQNYSAGVTFTEPLVGSKLFLIANYQLNNYRQNAQIQSLNPVAGTEDLYQVLDSTFSSHYDYNVLKNTGGLQMRFLPKKGYVLNAGADLLTSHYTQVDLFNPNIRKLNFLNLLPKASLTINNGSKLSFNFNYNTIVQSPTMDQIQPVQNNNDPLNIAIGNQNLKQSYYHNFSFRYFTYRTLSSSFGYLNGGLSLNRNGIVQKQNMDETGVRTYQFVNTNGNYNLYLGGGYGRGLISGLDINTSLSGSFDKGHDFVNGLANTNKSWGVSPSLSFTYTLDTFLNLDYSFSPSYNNRISTIQRDIKSSYWNFKQTLSGSMELPAMFMLGTDVDWEIRQQLNAGDVHNKVFLWNAWLSRSFLKDRSLTIQISVHDLLNQNVGYNRVASVDRISQSTYNTLKRYFMLKIIWNFTARKVEAPPGIIIMDSGD